MTECAPFDLIAGATRLPHGRGTLHDHLMGTYRILRRWQAPDDVVRAGLIHSIYSTQHYPHQLTTLGDRGLVQQRVGVEAERLAYVFCRIDRDALWSRFTLPFSGVFEPLEMRVAGEDAILSERDLHSLLLLEMANYAEQSCAPDRSPVPWMFWILGWRRLDAGSFPMPPIFSVDLGPLTWDDEERACRAYASAMGANPAAHHNPYAGEPQLVQAAEHVRAGDAVGASSRARSALALFESWQTAWDKRMLFEQWLELARDLSDVCSMAAADAILNGLKAAD